MFCCSGGNNERSFRDSDLINKNPFKSHEKLKPYLKNGKDLDLVSSYIFGFGYSFTLEYIKTFEEKWEKTVEKDKI